VTDLGVEGYSRWPAALDSLVRDGEEGIGKSSKGLNKCSRRYV
jgi:hypothetical protein